MSYNGIGLPTARGTGTNGFVTKNFASFADNNKKNSYLYQKQRQEQDAKNLIKSQKKFNLKSDEYILNHEKSRLVEIEVTKFEDWLEECNDIKDKSLIKKQLFSKEGNKVIESFIGNDDKINFENQFTDEDIELWTDNFREFILKKLENDPRWLSWKTGKLYDKKSRRDNYSNIHDAVQEKQRENKRFEKAFGIKEDNPEFEIEVDGGDKETYYKSYKTSKMLLSKSQTEEDIEY